MHLRTPLFLPLCCSERKRQVFLVLFRQLIVNCLHVVLTYDLCC